MKTATPALTSRYQPCIRCRLLVRQVQTTDLFGGVHITLALEPTERGGWILDEHGENATWNPWADRYTPRYGRHRCHGPRS